MPETYYEAQNLDGDQIEAALEAIDGVIAPKNNGKILAIEAGKIVAKSASEWTDTPVLEPLSVTANGDYTPSDGIDGYNAVHVAVPGATLTTKNITQNGTYDAPSDGADGYSSVTVAVPGGATIEPLEITQNGTYTPPSGVDGYAPVTVNVQGGGVSDNDLLFHFNDFTNSGKMNAAFYNKTGYLISDEQSKFGETSLKVNSSPSTGGAVYFEGGFTLADQDFTLDFWAYITRTTSSQAAVSFNYRSFGYYISSGVRRGIALSYDSGLWSYDYSSTYSLDVMNSWHHFAITRSGNTFHIFVDGIEEHTFEWDHTIAPMTRLSFGTNSSSEYAWRGYIDEFRLKIGEAVWTSNFTPPTEPYT